MSINRIALYHLETLIWIGRLGTFAAAAEQLNTTQPTISARVTELESRLGVKLFQRNGRLMTLTPSGRRLLSDYQPIWEQLQGALLRSSGFENFSGIVRVGAGEIAAATCLPHFVAAMKKLWQDLSFEIEIQLTAQLIQDLLAGRIDLAFAAGPVAHPALTATPIGAAELVWAASPKVANRIAAQDDDQAFSLWSLPSHSPIYQVMKDEVANLFVRQPSISLCNNVRTIIDILKQGDGLALMPKKMIERELHDTSLVEVLQDRRVQPIMFHVVSRSDESDPVVEEILQQARKTVL